MSKGITWDTLKEANAYKEDMQGRGYAIKIENTGNKYTAIKVGIVPTLITMEKGKGNFQQVSKRLINIDESEFQPHIALAHEMAHNKLGHLRFNTTNNQLEDKRMIIDEENAWRVASESLKKSGEWNQESKKEAIKALSYYYKEYDDKWEADNDFINYDEIESNANKKASEFINSL